MKTSMTVGPLARAELDQLQELASALPADSHVSAVLTYIATAVRDGLDVALIELDAELSPNQAAEFLRMSRPHLLKLLDNGFIPFHRVGRDRRIRNSDLVAFLQRRETARQDMAYVDAHRTDLAIEAAAESAGISADLLSRLT